MVWTQEGGYNISYTALCVHAALEVRSSVGACVVALPEHCLMRCCAGCSRLSGPADHRPACWYLPRPAAT